MPLSGSRTYVGFGFGAIQAGLLLQEAFRGGRFGRLVVAEVMPEAVAAMRAARGMYGLNIAHADRLERVDVGPVEILDPAVDADRRHLVDAVAAATDIGVAVPSVDHYTSAGPGSLHAILGEGLARKASADGPRAIVYASENRNDAAQVLRACVLNGRADGERAGLDAAAAFVNTVIGKMSGVVADAEQIAADDLVPITPGQDRAFLVEAFNRILISPPRFAGVEDPTFRRGIEVFETRPDLLPFEEAKLYGHNAVHALAAYLGVMLGVRRIADLPGVPGAMACLRDAFLDESGRALVARHRGVDPLFTPDGYAAYADDLLTRMTNPHLRDTVERVGRHVRRKLGWNDRLIGTINVCLAHDVEPRRFAFGGAAALVHLDPAVLADPARGLSLLQSLWADASPSGPQRQAILDRLAGALTRLDTWREHGQPPLADFLNADW